MLGVFREPLAGLEPQLAHIPGALEAIALDPDAALTEPKLDSLIADARAARSRNQEAAYQQLHRDPYRADLAPGILARVPPDLDEVIQSVVLDACTRLGFGVERMRGRRKFSIDFSNEALVESLPGVPGGSSFVGSFDREEAVEDESIDFFASGHPLVEGILAHVEDSQSGRVAYLEASIGRDRGEAVAAVYKSDRGFDMMVLDENGRPRPEWAAAFSARPSRVRPMREELIESDRWTTLVRRLRRRFDPDRPPYAIAALTIRPMDRVRT